MKKYSVEVAHIRNIIVYAEFIEIKVKLPNSQTLKILVQVILEKNNPI